MSVVMDTLSPPLSESHICPSPPILIAATAHSGPSNVVDVRLHKIKQTVNANAAAATTSPLSMD
jgi:hypothetical protein